jgi:Holliday junction resolvase RusA-like endonuclease
MPTTRRHLATFEVRGRPATFATAHEAPWKAAVRDAVSRTDITPPTDARFSVRIEFRTPAPETANEAWDIDNLVKPTLDAMEGVFGLRPWKGSAQAADDRVDHIEAFKRGAEGSEVPGARIDVWILAQADANG